MTNDSNDPIRDPASAARLLTDLVRIVLKMAAHAERAGTAMNREAGLTNARWLMLDQAEVAEGLLTVSEHARRMGLRRQAVQRLADEMAADGLVAYVDDPADRRARRVRLTERGRALQADALGRARVWAEGITRGLEARPIAEGVALLEELTRRMAEAAEGADKADLTAKASRPGRGRAATRRRRPALE